jgi:hypothetical protein
MTGSVLSRRGVLFVSRRASFHVISSPGRLVARRFSFFHFPTLFRHLLEKTVNRHAAFEVDCTISLAARVDFSRKSEYSHRCLRPGGVVAGPIECAKTPFLPAETARARRFVKYHLDCRLLCVHFICI